MRYLGVDPGTKRIGLALGEPDGGVVSPLKVLDARPDVEENARRILEVADQYAADEIVIGLPLNMDGTEGPQAKQSRALATAITTIASPPASGTDSVSEPGVMKVHLHDERLTSHEADQRLVERNLTRAKKKARQDAVAAQVLLQSFLDQRSG